MIRMISAFILSPWLAAHLLAQSATPPPAVSPLASPEVAATATAAAPAKSEHPLLLLARQRFPNMSAEDQRFFESVSEGAVHDRRELSTNPSATVTPPSQGASWLNTRHVPLAYLAWLCTAKDAHAYITSRGIQIRGAVITNVDKRESLQSVDVPFDLALVDCYFPEPLQAANSRFRRLDVSGSYFAHGIRAEDLTLDTSFLAVETTSAGNILLHRIRTTDNVDFSGCHVTGTIHLPLAQIGGDLRMVAAQLTGYRDPKSAEPGLSLNLDLANIHGTVSLSGDESDTHPFHSVGTVRMVLAKIGGNLDCWNGHFDCGVPGEKDALHANGLEVEGSVFLAHRFRCRGTASFRTARVRHYFNLYELGTGAQNGLQDAYLYLQAMQVGTVNCDTLDWAPRGRLVLNGFTYDRLEIVEQIGDREVARPLEQADFFHWLDLQLPDPFFPQPHEHLASVLKQEGYADVARDILIHKEQEQAKRSAQTLTRSIWYRLLGPMIGFGYAPLRGLRWLALLWLLSGLVFTWAKRGKCLVPAQGFDTEDRTADPIEWLKTHNYPPLRPWVYALDVMVPFVDFDQVTHWVPLWKTGAGRALQWYSWGLLIGGWILTTLVVAGLTGLVHS